jgi:hypothetical protein
MDPASDWTGGPHGHALDFDGVDDRVVVASPGGIDLGTANACVVRCRIWPASWDILVGDQGLSNLGCLLNLYNGSMGYQAGNVGAAVTHGITAGDEVWLGVSREGTKVTFYKNGLRLGNPQTLNANNPLAISVIGAFYAGGSGPTTMRCDYVCCWRRAVSAAEMAWLYQRPFCFVGQSIVLPIVALPQGTIHQVSGSAAATSSASAAATVIHAGERPTGRSWADVTPDFEPAWLREALLNGMTDVGFALGTVLTQGWFWMRRAGAAAVYRSKNPKLVAVGDVDAKQITLPAYLSHAAASSCEYRVQRFNACGQQDRTSQAVTRVRIGPDGQLAEPVPNAAFALSARQRTGGRVALAWFYWPLDQAIAPQTFGVHWDASTGEIDYVHPLATVPYEGRKFYHYYGSSLGEGTYRFAVQPASAAGAQGPARECEVVVSNAMTPQTPDVVEAEMI